ncbi:MAG TPA: type 2 isopentenyl-diphosphate Delta-isomerase [Candidatus Dormibacteraeota bacterium]|nr:type 2 isopentenyl-diphosphate Delta-isomerase [Candidatus Dormibacteraeota bacterium]
MTRPETKPDGAAQDEVERRKGEHLQVASTGDVNSRTSPGWPDVRLVHCALPLTDLSAIDLSVELLGRRLHAPLVISAMTGGHRMASEVNRRLASAAERHGLAMGLGSQRAALRNPDLAETYAVARRVAPNALLIANVGAPQLIDQASGAALGAAELMESVRMIGADALAIHLNFLEESVQTEGDRRAAGIREAIGAVVATAGVPVVAKETGAGISGEVAMELEALGFAAIDVGGLGGTSFSAVEAIRAAAAGDERGARIGEVFRDWGIPTAVSVVAASATGLPVIATGGIRSGLDAAKAVALGATAVGVARPLLIAALESEEALERWIAGFLEELRVAAFLTGCRSVAELWAVPRTVTGETRRWLDDLGYTGSRLSAQRRQPAT